MNYKKLVSVLIALLLISANVFSQNTAQDIAAAYSAYNKSLVQEKIYVHTDKNFYVAGEICWLKLYDVDAATNKPLALSKVGYVEILDSANMPVQQAKIKLVNAEGYGSLQLPLSISSGNYILRAYTNWMKNFGAENYFQKVLSIVNMQKAMAVQAVAKENTSQVNFFPEGGNLVNGLQSKVAFKATGQNGKSISFSGDIYDGNNSVVKFKSLAMGSGSFYFTPQLNHSYKVMIMPADGEAYTATLPKIYSTGYVMGFDDADKTITVQSNIADGTEVMLLIHAHGKVTSAQAAMLQNGKATFKIDTSLLAAGISCFTVFNYNKQPVCERLYFKQPKEKLNIVADADNSSYAKRQKVNLEIHSDGIAANTDSASLSMAVYQLDSLQSLNDITIDAYLQLTSELKGNIENPSFYFTQPAEITRPALENLLLTNGWRKFNWENMLRNQKPVISFPPEYHGHLVTAKIINTQTQQPAANIESFLAMPGNNTAFATSTSNADGNVQFEMKKFEGASKIILQTNFLRDSTYSFLINDPFSKTYSNNLLPAFKLPQNNSASLLSESISMQVQNIYFPKQVNLFYTGDEDSIPFYQTPDYKYNLDDYTRFATLEEVLREYVVLVNVSRKDGRYHFPTLDLATNTFLPADPLVLLDGVPVFDFNKFLNFDPLKIRKLETVNRKYYYGNSELDGILNWKTYSADMAGYELDPRAVVIDYEGLLQQREFYAPVYDTPEKTQSHLPDFRTTLSWQPDIKLFASAKKQLSFYTSDLTGRYAIVLQGLTAAGISGSKTIFIEVK